mgnify:CR=1 FL=1
MSLSPVFEREIRRSPLFSSLSKEAMKNVVTSSDLIRKKQDEILFSQGDEAKHFYVVRTGTIRLFLLAPDGNEKTINILQAGNSFAEAVMFMDRGAYPVNSQFLETGEVFSFNNQVYQKILHKNPETVFPIMADLSRRLQGHVMEIDNLCLHNATHRLISYLLSFIPADEHNVTEFHLPTQKSVIASRLSIQRETFSRILGKLKKSKMIEVNGNDIRILNADKMREVLID